MTVLFATAGFTPGLVVAPLRQFPGIETMHVFFGPAKDKKLTECLDSVREVTETFGVRLVEHQVKDPFDFDEDLRAFVRALDSVPEGREVIVNASSGPRPLIMAATIFCSTHDLALHYYDEYDTKSGKIIPLKAYHSLRGLGGSKRALLKKLQRRGPTDVSNLSTSMRLALSTTSAHVHELAEMGLVKLTRDGKRRIVALEPGIQMMDMESVS